MTSKTREPANLTVTIIDKNGKELTREELSQLNIWNPTMAHIFAAVIERMQKENLSNQTDVAQTDTL